MSLRSARWHMAKSKSNKFEVDHLLLYKEDIYIFRQYNSQEVPYMLYDQWRNLTVAEHFQGSGSLPLFGTNLDHAVLGGLWSLLD